jgi:hypothetical protein
LFSSDFISKPEAFNPQGSLAFDWVFKEMLFYRFSHLLRPYGAVPTLMEGHLQQAQVKNPFLMKTAVFSGEL